MVGLWFLDPKSKVVVTFMKANRLAYLDWLKIVAIIYVVAIHTTGFLVVDYSNSMSWFVNNIFLSIPRFAVPVFVMCSGVVFLGKKFDTFNDIKLFYKKYLPIYGGYLFLGLVVSKFLSLYLKQDIFILEGIFYNFHTSFAAGMWFFWMFIGLVLVTPILAQIAQNETSLVAFIVFGFLFSIFTPTFSLHFAIYKSYITNTIFSSDFVVYYMLGYYLSKTNDRFTKIKYKYILCIIISSILMIAVITALFSIKNNRLYESFYLSNNPFVFFYTVFIFILFKKIFGLIGSSYLLQKFSLATVYVYIFHISVLSVVPFFYTTNILEATFLRVPLIVVISFVVSFIWIAFSKNILIPVRNKVYQLFYAYLKDSLIKLALILKI